MSAHLSPKAKAPPSATKSASTGRGDLLRAWAVGVELAPSFLGYECTLMGSHDTSVRAPANQQLPRAGQSSKDKLQVPRRKPLRMPLAYSVMNFGGDPPLESEEPLQWTSMDKGEWGTYFQPLGAQPLVLDPLWPKLAQVRAWLDAAAIRQRSMRVDWVRTTQRLAQGHALQRLSLRAPKAASTDVHLLIDGSAPFQALEGDTKVLVGHLFGLCGRNLHVWRLPTGPEGKWRPVGAPHATPPAHWHGSLLLVFSDLGVVTGGSAAWQQALRQWANLDAQVHLLFPGFRHELPSWLAHPATCVEPHTSTGKSPESPTDSSSEGIYRLMQALSVALVLDAPLVRRVRQRLCEGASPLLELQLAGHPAVWQSALGVAQWRHGERAPYQAALADIQQWSTAQCQALASVVTECHVHVSQAIRDEELLEVASLPQLSARGAGAHTAELDAAAIRVARALGTLREAMLPTAQAPANAAWYAYVSTRCQRTGAALQAMFPDVTCRLAVLHALQAVPAGQPLRTVPPDSADLDVVAPWVQSLKLWLCQDSDGLWLQAVRYPHDMPSRAVLSTLWAAGRWLRVERGGQLEETWPLNDWKEARKLPPANDISRGLCLVYCDASAVSVTTGKTLRVNKLQVTPVERPAKLVSFEQKDGDAFTQVDSPWGLVEVHATRWSEQEPWGTNATKSDLPPAVSFQMDRYGVLMDINLLASPHVQRLRLRYIPAGTFLMGSPDDQGDNDEHPQHPVELTEAFWIAETPCTQALWRAIMGKNPSHFKGGSDGLLRPVEKVSFDNVQRFLAKLSALLPPDVEAVLPTEAQWEFACRAGTTTAYWWGDIFDPEMTNVDQSERKGLNTKEGTTPVYRYPPNPWGLYDMHGNVWEWCADSHREYTAVAKVNPMGAVDVEVRAVRGGSWYSSPSRAHSAFRGRRLDSLVRSYQGFRLVLRAKEPDSYAWE